MPKDNFLLIPDHRLKFLQNFHCCSCDCFAAAAVHFFPSLLCSYDYAVFIPLSLSPNSVFLAFEKHSNYFVCIYIFFVLFAGTRESSCRMSAIWFLLRIVHIKIIKTDAIESGVSKWVSEWANSCAVLCCVAQLMFFIILVKQTNERV